MGAARHIPGLDCMRRLLATVCAGLVFALGLFAANPTLHAKLHYHIGSYSENGCAVVLFAGGVSIASAPIAPLPPQAVWHEMVPIASVKSLPHAPRGLLPPKCGPPVA